MAKGGSRNHAGRKAKPTDLKVLQGTFREDRHGGEVRVPTVWPEPPVYLVLTDRQRDIWAALKDGDTWHAATDWPAVWGLVKSIDELIQNHEAQLATDTAGHPLAFKHIVKAATDAQGQPTELEIVSAEENPLKTAEMKWLDRLYKFIAINGYSPTDRAKMPAVGDVNPANPLDRFLKKRG